ncbi:HD domain-containing protein [Clostridium sp. Marseille-P2415]|uniref:HD domain-containing protein n=1 Tax=Clostridium sp. Marseille-P2415 TaxID=1805471 RepID=UPI001F2DDE60|nr:HD domain-containing protein [Clostridium sp. Marseille-P2415]
MEGIVIERITNILNNEVFKENLERNKTAERERMFCKHDLNHSIDVARIAYILNLEDQLDYDKELIYAVALLHDITKWRQYEDGTPHNISAAEVSDIILGSCGFHGKEKEMCKNAISKHRKLESENDSFAELMYKADKLSRFCFFCKAKNICNWSPEKMNKNLIY